ncbi:inactive hydroxysteroid dehydrogenase-like protein 1 isoform X2 [Pseudophryne corroboree]
MAAVDSFHLLYREVARSCHNNVELLAVVGALYTAKKGLGILYECYSVFRLHITPHLLSRSDLVQRYGEWAVVTGATDSIGRAYAEELANCGVNILLICRDGEQLRSLSEAIAEAYGVTTSFIQADFRVGRATYPAIKEVLKDVDVGILVNNAGVFCEDPQCFSEVPEEKAWEIINNNIAAAVMMAHIVIPGMVQRKRGAIVNVTPGFDSRYNSQSAASKSYLDTFSRHLKSEVASSGIFVQSLTPLCVRSKHTSYWTLRYLPALVPSPEVYARHAVRTLGHCNRTTGYWAHSLQLLVCRWIPGWLGTSIGGFLQQ